MAKISGSFVRLSLPRRIINHFLSGTGRMPLVTGQRRLRLAEVIAARAQAKPRPSWAALFTKAFAAVCARQPELRRTFVAWPWARVFQYDAPVVSVVTGREYEGEHALFLARVKNPDQLPLARIQDTLNRYKTSPIKEIDRLRYTLRLAALPGFIRHPLWWLVTNVMPRLKAQCLGTHGISPTTGMRSSGIHVVSPWTIVLHYDVPHENGDMDVRFTFDHRVYDAAVLGLAGGAIEQELCGPILAELRAMRPAAEEPGNRKAA